VAFLLSQQIGASTFDITAARRAALRVVLWQAVVTLLVASGALVGAGGRASMSALAGGGITMLASLAMVLVAFRGGDDANPKRIVRGFFRGEAVKLSLTVLLLVVTLRSGAVDALPMLAAFVAASFVYWFALIKN
jgi:ATP synthase protein I